MTQPTFVHKSQLLGAATALSAVGFLMAPAPAQADPMLPLAPSCEQYGFPGGLTIEQAGGWRVELTSSGGPFADGTAVATKQGQATMHGSVSGGIQGRHADFTIQWDSGPRGRYTGDIDQSGFAHGTGFDEVNPSSTTTWDSTTPFECATQAGQRPALSGRYRVDLDDAFELEGHPFRSTQTWDITSTCSSEDSCVAQVTPDHRKWTGSARFSIRTDVASMGLWTMVVDLPSALICTDGSGTKVPGRSVYTWGAFITGNGEPTESSEGTLDWSHDAGCGKPAETKGAVFTMTKVS